MFGLSAGSATDADGLNADADQILRSVSRYLAGTKAFSVTADMSTDVITVEQKKPQFNGHAELVVERPSHFYVARQGRFADAEPIHDGSKVTIYGRTTKG